MGSWTIDVLHHDKRMFGTLTSPFKLMWEAHDRRPFGFDGPSFNGAVTLTAVREDAGFSAMARPGRLHYMQVDGQADPVYPRMLSWSRGSGINEMEDLVRPVIHNRHP